MKTFLKKGHVLGLVKLVFAARTKADKRVTILPLLGERVEGLSTAVLKHNALSGTAGRLPYAGLWEQTGYTGFRTLFL